MDNLPAKSLIDFTFPVSYISEGGETTILDAKGAQVLTVHGQSQVDRAEFIVNMINRAMHSDGLKPFLNVSN